MEKTKESQRQQLNAERESINISKQELSDLTYKVNKERMEKDDFDDDLYKVKIEDNLSFISKVIWSYSRPIFFGRLFLSVIDTIAFKKLSLFQSV